MQFEGTRLTSITIPDSVPPPSETVRSIIATV